MRYIHITYFNMALQDVETGNQHNLFMGHGMQILTITSQTGSYQRCCCMGAGLRSGQKPCLLSIAGSVAIDL